MPSEMRKFILERVREQQFGTPTEYIRSLVREDARRQSRATLKRLLEEADESSELIPITPTYVNDLRARGTQAIREATPRARRKRG